MDRSGRDSNPALGQTAIDRMPVGKPGGWQSPLPVLPPHGDGQWIGLFGGSFNPPHEAHRLASLTAMHRLRLDRVWWIVSPGNPLKAHGELLPLAERMRLARQMKHHPRIDVTGFEAQTGSAYTYETILHLIRRCPRTRFVWIMGADNLSQFHRWKHWRTIAASVPIVIIDRPGSTFRALRAPAATALARYRLPEHTATSLCIHKPPAFIFLHGPRSSLSSTLIRRAFPLKVFHGNETASK